MGKYTCRNGLALVLGLVLFTLLLGDSALGDGSFFFSTGNPDGKIATLSRPAGGGLLETETADDFFLSQPTLINSATFVGLVPSGTPLSSLSGARVEIEFYHIFPTDSMNPPSVNVPTRMNSPADVEFVAADSAVAGQLSFTPTILSSTFSAANSVVNGIFKAPSEFTGGEGPMTGEEVEFDVTFTTPVTLTDSHDFFRPEVGLTSGNFLWLSAPKPIVAPGTPFPSSITDLQAWIRNANLSPDWLRIGTDITHQGPFNMTFSLSGTELTPLPSSVFGGLALLGGLALWMRLRRATATTPGCFDLKPRAE